MEQKMNNDSLLMALYQLCRCDTPVLYFTLIPFKLGDVFIHERARGILIPLQVRCFAVSLEVCFCFRTTPVYEELNFFSTLLLT